MKKITLNLFVLLFVSTCFGQTYSTGTLALNSTGGTNLNFSIKIDVTSTLVTMTMIGPSAGYLAVGFNNTSMANSGDVVIFDGTNLSDRTFSGFAQEPALDPIQNWTVSTNTVDLGVRTVVGTRARNTGDANDYVFSDSANALNIVYARKLSGLSVDYHGSDSCGSRNVNFTLGNDEFNSYDFKIYPNPSKGFVNIELPTNVDSGVVKMYDNLGRVVKTSTISSTENQIITSDLTTGSYLVVLRTDYGNATKTLIIE